MTAAALLTLPAHTPGADFASDQTGAPVFIRRFGEIDRTSITSVGGKGANLGEMTAAGLPVRLASLSRRKRTIGS